MKLLPFHQISNHKSTHKSEVRENTPVGISHFLLESLKIIERQKKRKIWQSLLLKPNVLWNDRGCVHVSVLVQV